MHLCQDLVSDIAYFVLKGGANLPTNHVVWLQKVANI